MLRILIVKLSAIGDVIHCLPAASAIKQMLPDCELTWLVEPASAPLLEGNPVVDRLLVLPKGKWKSAFKFPAKPPVVLGTIAEIQSFAAKLRGLHFDLAIDAQGLLKSAVLARVSGAKKVTGFAGTREFAEHLLSDRLNIGDYFGGKSHIVDLNLALAEFSVAKLTDNETNSEKHHTHVCFPLPAPSASDCQVVDKLLAPLGLAAASGLAPSVELVSQAASIPGAERGLEEDSSPDMGPLIGLIPGTTWATKIWPSDYWTELASRLVSRFSAKIILLGGPADKEIANHIYKGLQLPESSVVNLVGETSLMQLVALFSKVKLVIGADTGPMHLACATGGPFVLAVHGASPWLRNGPYGPRCTAVHTDLDCQPCFSKTCKLGTIACIKDLPVEKVFYEASKLLTGK
jgi:heptosyltransferase I